MRQLTLTEKHKTVVLVDEATVAETEQWLSACERCVDQAAIAFVYLLDALMECEAVTEYLMCRPARCPNCSGEVSETTLVNLGSA